MDNICEVCGGKAEKHCDRCRFPYCSRECQKKDWKVHKKYCTHIADGKYTIPQSFKESIENTSVLVPLYRDKVIVFIPEISGTLPKNIHPLDSDRGKEMLTELKLDANTIEGYKYVINSDMYAPLFMYLDMKQKLELLRNVSRKRGKDIELLENKLVSGRITLKEQKLLKSLKRADVQFDGYIELLSCRDEITKHIQKEDIQRSD